METWTFAHLCDMQPGSPRSFRYNPSWMANWRQAREQLLRLQPELLLVGGDLTRDGSLHGYELLEARRELASLPFPVHTIAGNMDTGNKHTDRPGQHRGPQQCADVDLNVTSAQLQRFADLFGPLWWTFEHRGVRFSGVTDMVINSGLAEEQAFWAWAEDVAALPRARHHVWITHYPPFAERPDEATWNIDDPAEYQSWYFTIDLPGRRRLLDLFAATGADLVISGHVHCHKVFQVGSARYVIAPATSFVQWRDRWPDGQPVLGFLRCDVTSDGIDTQVVPLARTHQIPGYGLGGHPLPELRDYTLGSDRGLDG